MTPDQCLYLRVIIDFKALFFEPSPIVRHDLRMKTALEVLKFWFEELTPEMHFSKSDALDERIRSLFIKTHEAVMNGKSADWRHTPEGRLAEIIVLDQFSRNMFRGKAQSFASDSLALKLATEAIEAGDDQKLPIQKRAFIYMPFMHSEDPKAHEKAMVLFDQKGLENAFKFEVLHKKIIDRFGRYPHRNEVLGRKSTPEEVEFLKEENSSF